MFGESVKEQFNSLNISTVYGQYILDSIMLVRYLLIFK